MEEIKLEQITNNVIDEDCICVVAYVDVGQLPKLKALEYLEKMEKKVRSTLMRKDIKILVMPSTCKLEIFSKKSGENDE